MGSLPPLALAVTAIVIAACTPTALPDEATTGADARRERSLRSRAGRTTTPSALTAPVAAASPEPARATVKVADQLRLYLSRVLADPASRKTWHRHIRQVTAGLHTAAIHTDLSSAADDRATAEQICLLASWFRRSPEGRHVTFLDVEVYGAHGDLLAAHDDIPDRSSGRIRAATRRATSSMLLPADSQPRTPPGLKSDDGRRGS